MENCVFCKIIKGEVPAYKIWENDKFIAILDIFPQAKGMTLVLPKEHKPSYILELDTNTWLELHEALKEVATILDTKLEGNMRTKFVFEGLDVPHLHAKLIPSYADDIKKQPHPEQASDTELISIQKGLSRA